VVVLLAGALVVGALAWRLLRAGEAA